MIFLLERFLWAPTAWCGNLIPKLPSQNSYNLPHQKDHSAPAKALLTILRFNMTNLSSSQYTQALLLRDLEGWMTMHFLGFQSIY